MLQVRKSEDRGVANFGWLDSKHSFSFGHYYDPNHVGFGPLLVRPLLRPEPRRFRPAAGD
jgi:quercetin 2,3-dioxygenase